MVAPGIALYLHNLAKTILSGMIFIVCYIVCQSTDIIVLPV